MRKLTVPIACSILASAVVLATAVRGDTIAWGDTGTDWGTGANWVGSSVPGAGDTANFPADAAIGNQPNVSGGFNVQGIAIDNSLASYLLGGSGVLTTGVGGITITGGGVTTIAPGLTVPSGVAQTWNIGNATLTLNGPLRQDSATADILIQGTSGGIVNVNGTHWDNNTRADFTAQNITVNWDSSTLAGIGRQDLIIENGTLNILRGNLTAPNHRVYGRLGSTVHIYAQPAVTQFQVEGWEVTDGSTLYIHNVGLRSASAQIPTVRGSRVEGVGTGYILIDANRQLISQSSATTSVIASPVTFGHSTFSPATYNWQLEAQNGAAAIDLDIQGVISQAPGFTGNLVLDTGNNTHNASVIRISGANTFTGTTSVRRGQLWVAHNSALGTGSSTITLGFSGNNGSAGAILLDGPVTLNRNVSVTDNNTGDTGFVLGGRTADASTFGGNVDMNFGTTGSQLTLTSAPNSVVTFAGNFTESASNRGLIKTGAGTIKLNGNNSYTGATAVNQGTLLVNGAHSGGGTYTVANGATLGGTGTITAPVTVNAGGTLGAGNSPGILHLGNLSLANNSTNFYELNGTTPGTDYDQLDVTGTVNLGSSAVLALSLGYTPMLGDSFTLIENDGTDPISGLFKNAAGTPLTQGLEFGFNPAGTLGYKISYTSGTGNDVVLWIVPEPSVLLLLGIGGMLLWRRVR